MADILLLHGFKSSSQSYFLPALAARYARDHRVCAPDLPAPATDIDVWTDALFDVAATWSFRLIVAHSLGGVFALSLLSRGLISCGHLVLIGSSPGPKENAAMNTFLRYPIDFERIRQSTRVIVIHSLDDPWTFPEYGIVTIRHSLGYGMIYADKGHFETPSLPQEILRTLDDCLS